MPTTEVLHNAAASCYELRKDGIEIGIAEYRLIPNGVDTPTTAEFHHTLVTPRERGQGNAALLVEGALTDVRRRGLKVTATCWYVDQFLVEHPDFADLRA